MIYSPMGPWRIEYVHRFPACRNKKVYISAVHIYMYGYIYIIPLSNHLMIYSPMGPRLIEYVHRFPACRMKRLKGCPDGSASTV